MLSFFIIFLIFLKALFIVDHNIYYRARKSCRTIAVQSNMQKAEKHEAGSTSVLPALVLIPNYAFLIDFI